MERVSAKLAEILGMPATREGFARVSFEACARAVDAISQPGVIEDMREANGVDPAFGLSKFLPLLGDDVIPVASQAALAAGAGAEVDLLIGSNLEEMNIYFVPPGISDVDDPALVTLLLAKVYPRAQEALSLYGLGKGKRAGTVLTEAMSDLVFRQPVRYFALAHRGRTHVYEFGWRSPAFQGRLGACHALELPFVFDTLATCSGSEGLVGEAAPQDLADHVHALWARFARDGSLPWPEFKADSRQVYRLEERASFSEGEFPAAQLKV
jgi:para-nitrobenzyl esterase